VEAAELSAFQSQYRDMSDTELVELYRLGPAGFVSPDIWQLLDAECHRRQLETEIDAQQASAAEVDAEDALIAQSLMPSPDGFRVPVEESLQLLRVHIGPNWNEHHKAAFQHFSEGGAKLHWNHAASLARGWLWYRRLYPVAVGFLWLYFGLPLIVALGLSFMRPTFAVMENVWGGVAVILVFGSALWRGGYGDSLVWEKAKVVLAEAALRETPEERMAYVRSEGGVRYTVYWLCAAGLVILKIVVRSLYPAG
jgi:hypothetical protein